MSPALIIQLWMVMRCVADLSADKLPPVAGKHLPVSLLWRVACGTCIRIMTGAPVPAGREAVVMQEQTE